MRLLRAVLKLPRKAFLLEPIIWFLITDTRLNEYFGFIQKDVEQILRDAGSIDHLERVKSWYDGYHFGRMDVYCPWDVMNYIRDIQRDSDTRPKSYWMNTSDNGIIRSFIDIAGSNITKKLETLLNGGYILQRIDENLTYDYLHSSEDNLWSILYLTGYLTSIRENELKEKLPDGISALMIPNAEIREIFETLDEVVVIGYGTVKKRVMTAQKHGTGKKCFRQCGRVTAGQ